MPKTMTKEDLAAELNGCEYRDDFPNELLQAAKENNLVIVSGSSDDIVSFSGAITDEQYACDGGTVQLTRKGVPSSDCGDENCPYFAAWNRQAVASGEIIVLEVFWCGRCKNEAMDAAEYVSLGKPTWCYRIKSMVGRYRREEIDRMTAPFDMFDTDGGEREFYCRGLVIDLDQIWPRKTYEQLVM